MNDHELIKQYLNGDHQAFNLLYHKYKRLVYLFTNQYEDDQDDSKDIAQDIWIKVLTKLSSMNNTSFKAWLSMIAKNTCIDHARSKITRRKREVHIEYDNYDETIDKIPYHILTGNEKKVLELKLKGFKHKEIAVELKMPFNSSLMYYRKAVIKLRNEMKEYLS